MLRILCSALLLACAATASFAQTPGPMLFSRLTVNQTHIVFSYAGDIWIVERAGGEARRLTTNPSEENFPVFSPDGSQIAFSRQVGGNWDVIVMPAAGGEERRLTFDPRTDLATGWTPDGLSVLLGSNANVIPQLYTIPLNGVMPKTLPLPKPYSAHSRPTVRGSPTRPWAA
jgi:tricorn protease